MKIYKKRYVYKISKLWITTFLGKSGMIDQKMLHVFDDLRWKLFIYLFLLMTQHLTVVVVRGE